jgi:hypothetical protein
MHHMATFSQQARTGGSFAASQSSATFAELQAVDRMLRAERQAHANTRQSLAAATVQVQASQRLTRPEGGRAAALRTTKPVSLVCLVRPALSAAKQKEEDAMRSVLAEEVRKLEAEQHEATLAAEAVLGSTRDALAESMAREAQRGGREHQPQAGIGLPPRRRRRPHHGGGGEGGTGGGTGSGRGGSRCGVFAAE